MNITVIKINNQVNNNHNSIQNQTPARNNKKSQVNKYKCKFVSERKLQM